MNGEYSPSRTNDYVRWPASISARGLVDLVEGVGTSRRSSLFAGAGERFVGLVAEHLTQMGDAVSISGK